MPRQHSDQVWRCSICVPIYMALAVFLIGVIIGVIYISSL